MVTTEVADDKDISGFGERLKILRQSAGLTQEQLAAKAGMKSQNIARLENSGRSPTWATAVRLAKALGLSIDQFLTTGD